MNGIILRDMAIKVRREKIAPIFPMLVVAAQRGHTSLKFFWQPDFHVYATEPSINKNPAVGELSDFQPLIRKEDLDAFFSTPGHYMKIAFGYDGESFTIYWNT